MSLNAGFGTTDNIDQDKYGKRGISKAQAKKLAAYFKVSAELLL